ncbi:MAG TPA: N-6 DNA methylase [Gemmatimonadaceae bacterium]|nr:N-6 DNA methylase [Gemmatimonadaceae bacterium]
MKGFVPTPPELVDVMVGKLFCSRSPSADDSLLDPGCGTGAFIEGVLRWCRKHDSPVPTITGIEADPALFQVAKSRFREVNQVTLINADFLGSISGSFDYIVGNPPYVAITRLTVEERTRYRERFEGARGRFDLYLLFFEQALELLKDGGRLVFVTPEKFLYVETAAPLRRRLVAAGVEEIELIDESAFGSLVTYPTVTTVGLGASETAIRLRDGGRRRVRLNSDGASWLPIVNGTTSNGGGATLADACVRISCGVATGADGVYVLRDAELPESLRPFAFPTVSGRGLLLGREIETTHSMLVPYARNGALLPEHALGALGDYLRSPDRFRRLMNRTCVSRKPWYAFHENPPLPEILQPKIVCKDIGPRPWFVVDHSGEIVPRHSTYYIIPRHARDLHELCAYLNSPAAAEWLMANCQRAANGFVRLQSHILKRMPTPQSFVRGNGSRTPNRISATWELQGSAVR